MFELLTAVRFFDFGAVILQRASHWKLMQGADLFPSHPTKVTEEGSQAESFLTKMRY
jgi:hypothetical protein